MSLPSPSEKQARVIWMAITGLAVATLAVLSAGLVWGLGRVLHTLSPVIWPLAIAAVVACLLDPVVGFLEKKGFSCFNSILAVFALALLLVGGLCGSVLPQIVTETRQLISRAPEYGAKLERCLEDWSQDPPQVLEKILQRFRPSAGSSPAITPPEMLTGSLTKPLAGEVSQSGLPPKAGGIGAAAFGPVQDWLAGIMPDVGRWLFGQVGRITAWLGVIAGMALVPVYAFYLLLERRGIESNWTEVLPVLDSRFKEELVFVLRSINGYLIAFFRGQLLVALCDAVLYTAGFLSIGLPYALLLGAAAVGLTMIPFLGAFTVCGAALVIAVAQFGDWLHPLLVLGVFGVVQTLEGLVISPRIMGDRVGLHPLVIIVAVMTGTTLLGGLLGGVLAIPLAAVLRVLLARYVWKKRAAS